MQAAARGTFDVSLNPEPVSWAPGTDGLAGLARTFEIEITEGEHRSTLHYALPD
jgi:hypothetical protein